MYILVLFLIIYNIFTSDYSVIQSIPTYLTNLQGIGFIIYGLSLPQINGLGHLWFLTVIMLCYLLLIIIKRIENLVTLNATSVLAVFVTVFFIFDIVLAYTIHIQLNYFIAFLIGYAFGKIKKQISLSKYLWLSGIMSFTMVIRLLTHRFIDNTITYNNIIVPFTHIILAVWIYNTIQYACQTIPNFMKSVAQNNVMHWLDKLSLYIYMTHYMFLVGPFYIDVLPFSKSVQLLAFVVGTFISAYILKLISSKINHILSL